MHVDTTPVRNFAYADDLLEITTSSLDMQIVARELSLFLSWHGVSINEQKSVYVSTLEMGRSNALEVSKWNGVLQSMSYCTINRVDRSTAVKYLGFWLSLNADFSLHMKKLNSQFMLTLGCLRNKRLTYDHLIFIVNSVFGGFARYYLAVPGIYSASFLAHWNAQIRLLICHVLGVTSKLSSGALYSKKDDGGAGVLDFVELASESCAAWLWHAIVDNGRSLPSSLILSRLHLLFSSRGFHLNPPFSSVERGRFSIVSALSVLSVYGISLVAKRVELLNGMPKTGSGGCASIPKDTIVKNTMCIPGERQQN